MRLKAALGGVSMFVDSEAKTGPQIFSVYNKTAALDEGADEEALHTVRAGTSCAVKGKGLKIVGDDEKVGLFLVRADSQPGDDRPPVRVGELSWNCPKEVDFNIPFGTEPGSYRVKLVTMFSGGKQATTKYAPRESVSEDVLAVV